MTRILSVIPSRVWVNEKAGHTASIYGAAPWTRASDRDAWQIVQRGWTHEMDNNTVGCGRVPCGTREEAEAFMLDWNNRLDDAARESLPGTIQANREEVARCTRYLAEASYPAARRSAKRNLQEAKARLAACESRLASLCACEAE